MSRSIDQDEQHSKEWERNKYKQYSQAELDKIAAQDAEREEAQAFIDEQVKLAVAEHPDMVSSPERNLKVEEAKKERERQRWRQFHYMGKD